MLAILFISLLLALFLPAFRRHPPEKRSICRNKLEMLAVALQNYHDVYKSFPPAYVADESGRRMHSWRVLILPFLDRDDLYQKYRFDEPWYGPNNCKLARDMPDVFRCPSDCSESPSFTTSYLAIVGPDTMWPGEDGLSMQQVWDGTSNTVILVESANSGIHWTEPRDLDLASTPLKINPPSARGISSKHPGDANVALADASVMDLANSLPAETIEWLILRNDGHNIPRIR
jgi:hypothetical protein